MREPDAVVDGPAFEPFFLDREALRRRGVRARDAYRAARPFPHAVIDGFLGEHRARRLAVAFPAPDDPGFRRRDFAEQSARLGGLARTGFSGVDPAIRHLLAELCGMAFLDFLEALTGQEGLVADPHFHGAGPSLTLRGGHLALHTDFSRDRTRHLARVVTVLYYLTPDWDPAWGGDLELWDASCARCEARIEPRFDRLVVMDHGEAHWHGHPAPLACPEGRARASIASYYYAVRPAPDEPSARGARWAPR